MPTIINGTTGVDQVTDNTLVVADAKSGQAVGFQKMQLFAAKATTTGTFVDFSPADGTGIPSWAKRVTVMLNGVSISGASGLLVQLGAGAVQTTGYIATGVGADSTVGQMTSTSGFPIRSNAPANLLGGAITFSSVSGNQWCGSGVFAITSQGMFTGGAVTLSGTLDRIRLTTLNGTDTFDAGSISILVEGYE